MAVEWHVRIKTSHQNSDPIPITAVAKVSSHPDIVVEEEDIVLFEVTNTVPDHAGNVSLWVGYQPLPLVFERVETDKRTFRYLWNVGFYAGEAQAFLVLAGKRFPLSNIVVKPRSTKTNDSQYQRMLEDLLQKLSSLFKESSVSVNMSSVIGGPRYYVLMAEQICDFWPSLANALRQIMFNPKKKVEETHHWQRLGQTRNGSYSVIHDYVTGKKQLPEEASADWETEFVWDDRHQVTEHIFENLATTGFLRELSTCIRQILLYFKQHPFYLEAILKGVYREVLSYLKAVPFSSLPIHPVTPKPTLTFRKDPRYATVYRCFHRFRKGVESDTGIDYRLPLMETYALYECWCYFKVVDVLEKITGTRALINLQTKNVFGMRVFDPLSSATAKVGPYTIHYQKEYYYADALTAAGTHSISHKMIPDIVVEGAGQRWLLDAKYRSGHIGLNDALGDMHKYRDAIRDADGDRAFPAAYILCPNVLDPVMRKRFTSDEYLRYRGLGLIELSIDLGTERIEALFRG